LTREELKILFDQYGRAITNYIYYRSGDSDLSEDVTQETFIRVWEKGFSYHPVKTKSLLYKIAGGLFIDHIRKNKIEVEYLDAFVFKLNSETD